MSTCVIHIGLDKTGSTSIQGSLRENEGLLRRNGVYFSAEAGDTFAFGYNHLPITSSLNPQPYAVVPREKRQPTVDLIGELMEKFGRSGCEDLVISDEHLSFLNSPQQVQCLRDLLDFDRYVIVCYVRKQHDWALSKYSTAVLCGRTQAFDPGVISPENEPFNVLGRLDIWSEVFGIESMRVRLFDRATLLRGRVILDFFHLLGLGESLSLVREISLNESPSLAQIESVRRCNHLLEANRIGDVASDQVVNNDRLRRELLNYLPNEGSLHSLYDQASVTQLLDRFGHHNQALADRYLSADEAEVLLKSEGGELPPPEQVDIERCLAMALVRMQRKLLGI